MLNSAYHSCGKVVGDSIEVFSYCPSNRMLQLLSLGSYLFLTNNVEQNELNSQFHNGYQNQSQNFQQRTIIAAAVDQPSFYYSVKFKLKESPNDIDEFEGGINVEAYRFLRDSLNFRERAMQSRGQMYPNDKGELQNLGIAQVLNSDRADIAISLYEPLPYRVAGPHGVRFLHSVFKSSKAIALFTQPPKNSVRNVYWSPFHLKVWIGVFLLYLLTMLILWLFLIIRQRYQDDNISSIELIRRTHFWMLCILSRQGMSDQTSHITCLRLVLLTGFISSVIFHSIFTSALTSIFAEDYQPISSISQIIEKRYTLYYDKYVPVITNILQNYSRANITVVEMGPDAQDIMIRAAPEIFDSKSALLTSQDRAYPFFNSKYDDSFLCKKLWRVPLEAVSTNANFVKQRSPYRDIFNIKFLLMQQSGLIQRLYKEHDLKTTLTCLPSFEAEFLTLDVYDTAFPFLILIYMSLISLCFLFGEFIGMRHGMHIYKLICSRRQIETRREFRQSNTKSNRNRNLYSFHR